MKKLLLCMLLLLGSVGYGLAQHPSAQSQAPNPSAFPNWLVVRVLQAAHPALAPVTGLNLGQMIQAYRNGGVTIEYVCRCPEDETKGVYRVAAGGADIFILVDDR